MVTAYGKFLRKLRIDEGEILKNMAEKLEVSSAFLSAVENGKKKIPKNWNTLITELYHLTLDQQNELLRAQEETEDSIEIGLDKLTSEQKEIAFTFARSIDSFDTRDLIHLIRFFEERKGKG